MLRLLRSRDALALSFLIALPFFYFWQITLGQGVWFGSDVSRTYYPLGVELSRALSEGRIPLWTTGMYGGFPILADAQIGALYPANLVLFGLLPAHFALSFSILLHLAWAACGMFLLVRSLGLRTSSACLAALVFSFSGFMFSRLPHVTVLVTSSWLPWLVFLQMQFQRAQANRRPTTGIWFFLTVLALGMQFLCGFPQVAFMNTLTVILVGLFSPGLENVTPGERWVFRWDTAKSIVPTALWIGIPILFGAGIVAAQLLPTAELVGYSVRGGSLDLGFVTSYSLPLESLTQFVFPFLHGEPSEGANNEYWAYLGLVPFALAILAPFLRRDRRTIFFAIFAVGALSLALGEINPAYQLIYRLPGFSLFRVPARYLLLVVFAAAILSAIGFQALSDRLDSAIAGARKAIPWGIAFGLLIVLSMWLAQTQWLEFWLSVWSFLPVFLTLLTIGAIAFAWKRKIDCTIFQPIVLGLTLVDLVSAAPLFTITLGRIESPAYVAAVPRSLAAIDTKPGDGRVFTDQYIDSSVPAIRASLYPNAALIYGKESAQAYSSLALALQSAYLSNLSPAMLNLSNVRYFTIPLEPRPKTKLVTPFDTLALDVLNNEEVIPPTVASAIEIVSFTEQADGLTDGTPVGQVAIRHRDGHIDTFPLRVGIETADWDYERKNPQRQRAQIAHSFSGFWRSFGSAFEGHTYSARFTFAPDEITGVAVRVSQPNVRLTVERITLYNSEGKSMSLAKLVGKNDFVLSFLSDTVAVWKNLDAMPRAFIVHATEIANDDVAFARLKVPEFRADRLVLLSDGAAFKSDVDQTRDAVEITDYKSEQVSLSVVTDQPGYLVLTDSWYPGWNASVDGQPVTVQRADVLFRAVRIEPGTHTVVFEYHPMSFVVGVIISLVSLLVLAGISVFYFRFRTAQS